MNNTVLLQHRKPAIFNYGTSGVENKNVENSFSDLQYDVIHSKSAGDEKRWSASFLNVVKKK